MGVYCAEVYRCGLHRGKPYIFPRVGFQGGEQSLAEHLEDIFGGQLGLALGEEHWVTLAAGWRKSPLQGTHDFGQISWEVKILIVAPPIVEQRGRA